MLGVTAQCSHKPNFSRHPERSKAESNFFVLDPKRRCAPFAPHCVRSSTTLRMTQTKKRRAKQGGIYEQPPHNVRTLILFSTFNSQIFQSVKTVLQYYLRRKSIYNTLAFFSSCVSFVKITRSRHSSHSLVKDSNQKSALLFE